MGILNPRKIIGEHLFKLATMGRQYLRHIQIVFLTKYQRRLMHRTIERSFTFGDLTDWRSVGSPLQRPTGPAYWKF